MKGTEGFLFLYLSNIINIIILRRLDLDRHASAPSDILLKGLPSRRLPVGL